ncbi:MAG TPA: NifU family protein [Frankiaceae bacterium]|nr:NifU family protein [Frankiaceae bacterium]
MTVDAAAVERALDEIRPHLHGGVELVSVDGDVVRVRMNGECADCTLQQVTLRTGVERVVRARVPAVSSVIAV